MKYADLAIRVLAWLSIPLWICSQSQPKEWLPIISVTLALLSCPFALTICHWSEFWEDNEKQRSFE